MLSQVVGQLVEDLAKEPVRLSESRLHLLRRRGWTRLHPAGVISSSGYLVVSSKNSVLERLHDFVRKKYRLHTAPWEEGTLDELPAALAPTPLSTLRARVKRLLLVVMVSRRRTACCPERLVMRFLYSRSGN
jgi:hypothetical protein